MLVTTAFLAEFTKSLNNASTLLERELDICAATRPSLTTIIDLEPTILDRLRITLLAKSLFSFILSAMTL